MGRFPSLGLLLIHLLQNNLLITKDRVKSKLHLSPNCTWGTLMLLLSPWKTTVAWQFQRGPCFWISEETQICTKTHVYVLPVSNIDHDKRNVVIFHWITLVLFCHLVPKDTHSYRSFHISGEAHKLLGKCQQKWRKWQKPLPDLEKDIIFKFMSLSIRKNPRGNRNLWEQISHWSYCYLSQCSILLQLSDLVESGEFYKVSICEIKVVLELESKVLRIVLWF